VALAAGIATTRVVAVQFNRSVCLPGGEGRHGAEDCLWVATGGEAKLCSAIIDEVELGVLAAVFKLGLAII